MSWQWAIVSGFPWLDIHWVPTYRQPLLPFWCELYGDTCDYVTKSCVPRGNGFYGHCAKCLITYDPVNDR